MTVRKIKTDQLVKIKNNICMPRGDSFSEYPTYIKHWEDIQESINKVTEFNQL